MSVDQIVPVFGNTSKDYTHKRSLILVYVSLYASIVQLRFGAQDSFESWLAEVR